MPKVVVPRFETLPDGVYRAELAGVEEKESDSGLYWRWNFDVLHKGETIKRSGNTSRNFGSKSNAYKWATVLLGRRPRPGEVIDLDDLIGESCQLQLMEGGSEGRKFNKVETVLPVARAAEEDAAGDDGDDRSATKQNGLFTDESKVKRPFCFAFSG
jgi:hypothetical protein